MNNEPIIYVGGDHDDQYLVKNALVDIGCINEVICFETGPQLIDYMQSTCVKPFMILCDLHLPGKNGFETREQINDDEGLRRLSIPFIFMSEVIAPKDIERAYFSLVQGFYKKAADYEELKDQLDVICKYWKRAVRPLVKENE